MKKNFCLVMILFLSVFFFVSCSRDKEPAELAIKAAEETVTATKAEVAKIVPEEVKSLEDTLITVKAKFTDGEYKNVLQEAIALTAKAKEILKAAKVKQVELTQKWKETSQELPQMFEDIQAKVDSLSKLKKLPAKITKKGIEEAKAGLASVKNELVEAQAIFTGGNLNEAISRAASLKDKAIKIMESLGMSVPVAEFPALSPASTTVPGTVPDAAPASAPADVK
ncbi:MAG: hypothetical protein JW976_08335 [Syntrophaceae bacterium]|nr:hypothetical protein [Syntrophaceae bacterium]